MSQSINSGYIKDSARDMVGGVNLKYDFGKFVEGLSVRMVGNVSIQNRSYVQRSKRAPVYAYGFDKEGKESYILHVKEWRVARYFSSVADFPAFYQREGIFPLAVGLLAAGKQDADTEGATVIICVQHLV